MDRKMIVLMVVGAIAIGLLTLLVIALFLVDEDGGSQGAPLSRQVSHRLS